MKLIYLKIEQTLFTNSFTNSFSEHAKDKPLTGTVEFSGTSGKMSMSLTQEDIENIQQLLLKKTKDLASEA